MSASKRTILAQRAASAARSARTAVGHVGGAAAPGYWFAFAVMALSGAAAFGLAPGTTRDAVPVHTVLRELAVPTALATAPEEPEQRYWQRGRIERGDTLGSVLSRLGVDDPDAMQFLRTNAAARALYQLRPGKSIAVRTDDDGALQDLRFLANDGALLEIARDGEGFRATSAPAAADVRWEMAAGEIRSSLFAAADAAALPDAVTMQLADVFAGDIDFYKDIKRGDRFAVVYEMRELDGEPVGAGRIVAARFENRGRTLEAYLWRDESGNDGYYTSDGVPLQRAFLRAPLAFSRVTSGFSLARFHPILNTWRAHKGVDYAAPIGTPVRATANGTVLFAGRQEGYGNVIHLKNQGMYSTLYAHLSRFAAGMKQGVRVRQGEVIGYVGQTGWATGPHLHYEFRVANVQRDPLAVALPTAEPLPASAHATFRAGIVPAASELALISRVPVSFASAD
jgi:murein DD-endopeptidase MepM/ murein hydrolase activator NlpD